MSSFEPLKVVLFMGSAREVPVMWNKDDDGRLGNRVLAYTQSFVAEWNQTHDKSLNLDIEVLDVLQIKEFQQVMRSPVYYLPADAVPEKLKELNLKVEAADAIMVVTPEYNHSIPSALSNMMNFFGGSKYGFKPSGCICYSCTPVGGPRVASALRTYLGELGCLAVSKQVIFTEAFQTFDKDGKCREGKEEAVRKQMFGLMNQLTWWAAAARSQRAVAGKP